MLCKVKVCQQPLPAFNTALCYTIPKPFDSEWNPGQLSAQDLSVRFKISVIQLQKHKKDQCTVDGRGAYLLIIVVDKPKSLMPNKECWLGLCLCVCVRALLTGWRSALRGYESSQRITHTRHPCTRVHTLTYSELTVMNLLVSAPGQPNRHTHSSCELHWHTCKTRAKQGTLILCQTNRCLVFLWAGLCALRGGRSLTRRINWCVDDACFAAPLKVKAEWYWSNKSLMSKMKKERKGGEGYCPWRSVLIVKGGIWIYLAQQTEALLRNPALRFIPAPYLGSIELLPIQIRCVCCFCTFDRFSWWDSIKNIYASYCNFFYYYSELKLYVAKS